MARPRWRRLELSEEILAKIPTQSVRGDTPQTNYWDASVPGFGVRVGRRTKTFLLNMGDGKRIVIGRYPEMTYEAAKKEALRLRHERWQNKYAEKEKKAARLIRAKQRRSFDATQGEHWITRLPDGQWAVFWAHPMNSEWHRLIAKFASRDRAETYAIAEQTGMVEGLAQPDQIEPPPLDIENSDNVVQLHGRS